MKNKYLKYFKNSCVFLIIIASALLLLRIFYLEYIGSIRYNFMAPVGKIMEKDIKSFSFIAASDTGENSGPLEAIIEDAKKSDIKFMVYAGDFVSYSTTDNFGYMVQKISKKLSGLPFYAIPGNHDVINEGNVDYSSYNKFFAQPYYWFSYGDTLFIALDSATSAFSDEQLEWLNMTLTEIRPMYKNCIIYCHVPPSPLNHYRKRIIEEKSNKKFAKTIEGRNINLIISGHLHDFQKGGFNKIPLIILPSSGQKIYSDIKKFGYAMVNITSEGITVEEKYIDYKPKIGRLTEDFIYSAIMDDDFYYVVIIMLFVGIVAFLSNRPRIKSHRKRNNKS